MSKMSIQIDPEYVSAWHRAHGLYFVLKKLGLYILENNQSFMFTIARQYKKTWD